MQRTTKSTSAPDWQPPLMLAVLAGSAAEAASERPLFVSVGASSRAPIGWVEFCAEHKRECDDAADGSARRRAHADGLGATWCGSTTGSTRNIKPLTDLEHWGVVERWNYPDDGYGDCEDYVLLKRRMLMQAGWPRQALLITVVRDKRGDGHAVLTVKTDKGEFILDNQNEEVLLWSETNYRFVKRQSQTDPNVWVALGDPRPATATATSR